MQAAHPCTASARYGAGLPAAPAGRSPCRPTPWWLCSPGANVPSHSRPGAPGRARPVGSHPGAADGQATNGSGSLQSPLLFSRPALRAAACGGRPRPGSPRGWPATPPVSSAASTQLSDPPLAFIPVVGGKLDANFSGVDHESNSDCNGRDRGMVYGITLKSYWHKIISSEEGLRRLADRPRLLTTASRLKKVRQR